MHGARHVCSTGLLLGIVCLSSLAPSRLHGADIPATPTTVPTTTQPAGEPGLWLTFSTFDGVITDTRPARLVALCVPAGTAPSALVPAGAFRATFTGAVDLKLRDEFTFTAQGRGEVELSVNGDVVLKAAGDDLSTQVSKPVRLKKGANAIVVRYTLPAGGDAVLRLYWTPKRSFLQPIPPTIFSRSVDEATAAALRLREGRELVGTLRCIRCHAAGDLTDGAMPELAQDAPRLDDVGARLNAAWIARWVTDPKLVRRDATMPRLFHTTDVATNAAAARDVAAYLATLGKPSDETKFTGEQSAAGQKSYNDLGCIACHTAPDQDAKGGFTPLRHVKAKWQPGALKQYLLAPERLYAWTRMPNFKLTDEESSQLAAYLLAAAPADKSLIPDVSGADAKRGEGLFISVGCLNCHSVNGATSSLKAPALPEIKTPDAWRRGCVSNRADDLPAKAPDFGFEESQLEAIRAFAATDRSALTRDAAPEFVERQVRQLNCTACHTRDRRSDVWSSLAPAAQPVDTKIDADQTRPTLTWVGEKLRPEWTARFIGGNVPYKPRPWLHARMPAFASRAELLAQGLSFEHGYPLAIPSEPPADPSLARIGQKLSGRVGGFSCNQCHAINKSPALVPFDSPAPNFMNVTERLRKDYYHRWLRNPQVFQPGTKMPTFPDAEGKTSFRDVLGGDAHAQFEAIWQYLRAGDQIVAPE
jgi:mono/diheme cytochrome c family protein